MNEKQENSTRPSLQEPSKGDLRDCLETSRWYWNRRPLRRSRSGWVFGVCKGLAEYADLPVVWIRLILVGLTLLSWILPFVILYTVAAFLMKPEPALEPEAKEEWKSYSADACAQSIGLANLRRDLDELERQAHQLERVLSARQFDWLRRLQQRA